MKLRRLLHVLGIILIFWAIISGLYIHIGSNNGNFTFDSKYTFKIGTVLLGFLLILLGKRK